jgi:hypothetical protein
VVMPSLTRVNQPMGYRVRENEGRDQELKISNEQ